MSTSSDVGQLFGGAIVAMLAIAGVVIFASLFGLLMAFPIKWTWNYVMPYLFGFKLITWAHAWCLSFLASCLVKSTQTNNNKKD